MASSQPLREMPLEDMVVLAQRGDGAIQHDLLKNYQPFIARCVSEVCRRYIDPRTEDEFSIGLNAFNEAILSYSPEKGSSFLTFSRLVIKRKVIDYIRYVQKTPIAMSLDDNAEGDQMDNPVEVLAVRAFYREEQNARLLREEIMDYKEKLHHYKMTLFQLTHVSPKHRDARETAITVARTLYNQAELRQYVQEKKKLPLKDLVKLVNVSKKTLERNRLFILSVFIILEEDYTYLKEYLKGVGE